MTTARVDVAIVGGGPAGAALASRLAGAGRDVVVLERAPGWRWRAGGVFASPAAVVALRDLGLDAGFLEAVTRPVPAMRVETIAGTTFRLTYGTENGGAPAVGFDRSTLDPGLLELARARGADVRAGTTVTAADLRARTLEVRTPDGSTATISAGVIVGADGLRSTIARAAGVARPVRLAPRVGLTYHLAEGGSAGPSTACPRRPDAAPSRRLCRDRAGARRPGQCRDRPGRLVAERARP